ncbi:hypothetical protein [Desulfovibrio inopinatus]|uniref:hypothetical protein n=1 Tax=Desulfovibrio inopinatus TaxID=102109 RepID=UPI0003F9DE37|nr:hypothetical protein [Desulfovibrio inopinatus]
MMSFARYIIVSYRITWHDGVYSAVVADFRQRRILAQAKSSVDLGEILTELDDLAQDMATAHGLPVKVENYFFDPMEKGIYLEKRTFEPVQSMEFEAEPVASRTGRVTRSMVQSDLFIAVSKIVLYWMIVAAFTALLIYFYALPFLQAFLIALAIALIPFWGSITATFQHARNDMEAQWGGDVEEAEVRPRPVLPPGKEQEESTEKTQEYKAS